MSTPLFYCVKVLRDSTGCIVGEGLMRFARRLSAASEESGHGRVQGRIDVCLRVLPCLDKRISGNSGKVPGLLTRLVSSAFNACPGTGMSPSRCLAVFPFIAPTLFLLHERSLNSSRNWGTYRKTNSGWTTVGAIQLAADRREC